MLTLLGSLLGFLSSAFPDFLKLWRDHADRKHELAILDQRSTLRRKINREEHAEVPEQFMRWVWAGGRKLKGLVRRRAAEAGLYAV